jgi:hypothetical protein
VSVGDHFGHHPALALCDLMSRPEELVDHLHKGRRTSPIDDLVAIPPDAVESFSEIEKCELTRRTGRSTQIR